MITLIAGTNRTGSNTRIVTDYYAQLLKKVTEEEVTVVYLEDLPENFAFRNDVLGNPSAEFSELVKKQIIPATKLVFVIPEYNGGFPGVLKAFLDGIWPENLKGKHAALVGIASGRAGNLRGMDHLTNVLHYLKMHVFYKKIPISGIDKLLSADGIVDEYTINLLKEQALEFIQLK